jgi:hypothetical protein
VIAGLALALAASAPTRAGVAWEPGGAASLDAALARAGQEERLLVLVVSDPVWCVPCSELHGRWLDAPDEEEVAALTRDALLVHADPSEPGHATALSRHGVRWQGLPSVLAFRPEPGTRRLGRAPVTGAVVGAPSDFPQRLAGVLRGPDAADALQQAVDAAGPGPERAARLLQLGDLQATRGQGEAALDAYRAVGKERGRGLEPAELRRLEGLQRHAEWKEVGVRLQLLDAPAAALDRLERFERRHPRALDYASHVAHGRALALGRLGRAAEAVAELQRWLAPRRPSAAHVEALSWTCLEIGGAEALRFAEREAREAATRFPERRAALLGEVGRLLRAQGLRRPAIDALTEALEVSRDPVERRAFRRQLEALGAFPG